MPSYEQVAADPVLYAHASRILHMESNPGNARALVQRHGDVDVWLNPPPIPLTTKEMDGDLRAALPARAASGLRRGEDPGVRDDPRSRSRSSAAVSAAARSARSPSTRDASSRAARRIRCMREIETIRDTVPGFTGVISDLGGPTANMYRLACKSPRDRSGVPPAVVRVPGHLPEPRHRPRAADPAVPPRARAAGHQEGADRVGRALRPRDRVAGVRQGARPASRRRVPEDRARGDLRRTALEDDEAGRRHVRPVQGAVRQVLEGGRQGAVPDPVLHCRASRHDRSRTCSSSRCGSSSNGFRADQVQAFLPSPMATATAMYHSGKNPLHTRHAHERRGHDPEGPAACAGCTRRSCAITTRTTGRCCARRCATWGART